MLFKRNVTYSDEIEGILVHFRLKLRDTGLGIVRSVRFSSNRVVSVIEGGHAMGGNVKTYNSSAYALISSRMIVIVAAMVVEVSSAHNRSAQ